MSGFGRFYEITLEATGTPDPQTGYLIGIHEIDQIVRLTLAPIIADQIQSDATTHPGSMLPHLFLASQQAMEIELSSIHWQLTPYYTIHMDSQSHQSDCVLVRQRFDFAAAHRLHTPTMSDQENANYFGKCNNLHGHGHNYQIEPCIQIPVHLLQSQSFQQQIEEIVNTVLIEPLDHRFLNVECPWFDQSLGGVIPSVENIARVCFEQLAPELANIADGIKLVSITAWETEKTSSIYPAHAL